MTNPLKKDLDIFGNKHFCVIKYKNFHKNSMICSLKVLENLTTVLDKVHFKDNLDSFPIPPVPPGTLFVPPGN